MLKIINGCKYYQLSQTKRITALDNVNLTIEDNDYVGIIGHSGSGKSTLLNILAGYEKLDEGNYFYNDRDVSQLSQTKYEQFNRMIGFVFQDYQLLNDYPIRDNILLGSYYINKKTNYEKLNNITKRLKINELLNKYPWQLSGGEKQRVALARTLLAYKKFILADEPTGALDKENSELIMEIFDLLYQEGLTVLVVTHNEKVAKRCKRIIRMENGHVYF